VVTWLAASPRSGSGGNRILSLLPPDELVRLLGRMEEREVEVGEALFEPGDTLRHVYFPETAVVSLLTRLSDGSSVEVATVGREGIVGVMVFLGDDRSVNGVGVVQMPGRLLRLDADVLRAQASEGGKLPSVLQTYARALLLHLSQSTACAIAHPVRARLSRWLLQTSDRTASDDVPLTQQFLSEILGVRRASVTEAMGELQTIGAVRTRRGGVLILDRPLLADASCECYAIVRDEYDRLLPTD